MTTHELKPCSTCGSNHIEVCKDTTLTWCYNCNDWAGGELDRVAQMNNYDRPLPNDKVKTPTGEVVDKQVYDKFSDIPTGSAEQRGVNQI